MMQVSGPPAPPGAVFRNRGDFSWALYDARGRWHGAIWKDAFSSYVPSFLAFALFSVSVNFRSEKSFFLFLSPFSYFSLCLFYFEGCILCCINKKHLSNILSRAQLEEICLLVRSKLRISVTLCVIFLNLESKLLQMADCIAAQPAAQISRH